MSVLVEENLALQGCLTKHKLLKPLSTSLKIKYNKKEKDSSTRHANHISFIKFWKHGFGTFPCQSWRKLVAKLIEKDPFIWKKLTTNV